MAQHLPFIVITGLSGSGKSTALNVFEDMGYFTVDGMPVTLVAQLMQLVSKDALAGYKGLVLGMDLRHIEFFDDYDTVIQNLISQGFNPQIIFFEATEASLLQRYAATRRPHPMTKAGVGLEHAIQEERYRLKGLRDKASLVVDTTTYSIHDLRRVLQEKWQTLQENQHSLRIHLISFGFKYGTPSEADMVFDLRFLPNPYFIEELRPFSGKDLAIQEFVLRTDPGKTFFQIWYDFLLYVLEQNEKEGRFRLSIAVGCTGGRHRSVSFVESLFKKLQEKKYACSVEHRHLELG